MPWNEECIINEIVHLINQDISSFQSHKNAQSEIDYITAHEHWVKPYVMASFWVYWKLHGSYNWWLIYMFNKTQMCLEM
jgi:hypothetical protein